MSPARIDTSGLRKAWAAAPMAARAGAGVIFALLVWVLMRATLPHGSPPGILISGIVFGAINSLVALSIVLIYRANRVINFAAAEFGSVAAVVAIELHIQEHLNYFLSIAAGLVLSAALGAALEVTIMRRFGNAPRLIVAVVTIGLAQILNGVSVVIPAEWSHMGNSGTFTTPFNIHFTIAPVVFNGNYVLAIILVPAVMAFMVWFLRYTHYGVAIRAAADNGDRAKLLGIPVQRLSTVVWTITGVLSALAVLLRVPILGFSSFSSVSTGGIDLLVLTLTAAVVAGMNSLPVTVLASLALGVVEQQGSWSFQNAAYVDVTLLVVILAALLLRRDKLSRAIDTGIGTWQAIRPVRDVPPEMQNLGVVRFGRTGIRMAILAFALILPFLLQPARTQLASLILVYAMVACSLVVLTGWAGHISLGQVAFMGFGGATTAMMMAVHGIDMWLALLAATIVSAVIAVIIGVPALRISGPFLAVATLAFALASANYFLVPHFFPWFATQKSLDRPPLFGRIAISTDRQMYFVCLVALVVVYVAVRTLRSSHAGRSMIAGKENRLAAQSFGIDTVRTNLFAFAVSGAIAGLAGGVFVIQQQGYNFSAFNAEEGLQFFTMVVIGGLGSLPGAVLGAVYVYGVQYLLPPGWSVFATGIGIVFLLMFLPGGLGELVFRLRDSGLRRIARSRNMLVPSLLADQREEAAAAEAELAPPTLGEELEEAAAGASATAPVPDAPLPLGQPAVDEPAGTNGTRATARTATRRRSRVGTSGNGAHPDTTADDEDAEEAL